MKSNEQITKEIHEIALGFSESSFCTPYVAILQPRRDFREVPAQQLQSHINRMIDFTSMSVSFHAIDGNPVDVADNYLIEKALEDNAKYALFIEEDTVLPSYGAVRLIETAEKYPDSIIVGVYYVKFGGPMISQLDEEKRWTYIDATPNTGLRRNIPSCGLGCALIPLSVIRKIKAKFVDIPLFCIVPEKCWGDDKVKALGQDTWFYNLVAKCGIEVICDTSVQCLHIELSTGKYSAHPDVNLDDYITNMPITEPLTLKDRNRVSAEYINRMRQPQYINGINVPVVSLPIDYSENTVDLVKRCLEDVQSTQNYYEVARLCERIKTLQPRTILEIGVDRGGSMNLWLNFAPSDALYIGVDNAMQFVIQRNHYQEKVFIEADSTKPDTVNKVKDALDGREVDFLFIDGNHNEFSVRSDFKNYADLVRKGGIIALHDISGTLNMEHCAGVRKLWEEVKTSGVKTEELVNEEAEIHFGIGVIHK
jgi:predicted O-methyltransferase YrrM